MKILFSGPFRVEYAQFYVLDDPDETVMQVADSFPGGGRRCAADVPGVLFLLTALHTGLSTVEVTLSDGPPEDDGTEWATVEDVEFTAPTGDVALVAWAGERTVPLDIALGTYRVRYHSTPPLADALVELDALATGDPVGRTWLHFWPLGGEA